MKKVFAVLGATLMLSACGSSAKQLSANSTVRSDEAAAQKKVQGCASKIVKGKQAFINCIAPAGEKQKVETCVTHQFETSGNLVRKNNRKNLENAVVGCLIR